MALLIEADNKPPTLYISLLPSKSRYIINNKENCFGVIKMNYSNKINTIYLAALLIFILIDKK